MVQTLLSLGMRASAAQATSRELMILYFLIWVEVTFLKNLLFVYLSEYTLYSVKFYILKRSKIPYGECVFSYYSQHKSLPRRVVQGIPV